MQKINKYKNLGSGWHNDSIRHSNAKVFGIAGGLYAERPKFGTKEFDIKVNQEGIEELENEIEELEKRKEKVEEDTTSYDEMLDETKTDWIKRYDGGRAFKDIDEIAYNVGFDDYIDEELSEIQDEIDEKTEELEKLKNENK